jgi:LEA14-like dessication related protein
MSKKNSSTNLLLIGAAAIAAWYFWTRTSALNSLIFTPVGLGVQGPGISLAVNVANPTNTPLQLSSIAGSLNINGSAVGNVTDFQPAVIAPNSQTQINLLITPNVFGLAAGVINEVDGNEGSGTIQASLTGTANVNNTPLPINLAFS